MYQKLLFIIRLLCQQTKTFLFSSFCFNRPMVVSCLIFEHFNTYNIWHVNSTFFCFNIHKHWWCSCCRMRLFGDSVSGVLSSRHGKPTGWVFPFILMALRCCFLSLLMSFFVAWLLSLLLSMFLSLWLALLSSGGMLLHLWSRACTSALPATICLFICLALPCCY